MQEHYKDWPNDAGFTYAQDFREPIELEVIGTIPDYAKGQLFRTGPGGYKLPHQDKDGYIATTHWFDGYATTHKFDISDKVMYSSYNQVDELIENTRRNGRREDITFGQRRDPCAGLFHKIKTMFTPEQSSNPRVANINVAFRQTMPAESKLPRTISLTTDTAKVKQIDMDTLEPLGVTAQTVLHPSLIGPLSATHAQYDETGDIFNYNLSLGAWPRYRIFRSSPTTGKTDILATVWGNDIKAAYMHSMMISENYVILCIWPAHLRLGGLAVLWLYNMIDTILPFDHDAQAVWLVIDRRHGKGLVKKFTSPAFFCFHTVNAWEETTSEGTDIICELLAHTDMRSMHWFYYENMVSSESNTQAWHDENRLKLNGGLARYRLRDVLSGGTAKAERTFYLPMPRIGELPSIHPSWRMKQHRYVWSILDRQRSSLFDGLGKTDLVTGKCITWEHSKHTPGEPVFVPKPGSDVEDEGVILTIVLNGETGESYFLCLDAATMKEIARADVGHPVGHGFHGIFMPR